jgi:hypothetical protein
MSKKNPWKMNPKEVATAAIGSMRSGRLTSRRTKQPSSMDEKSKDLTLTHLPTGITVAGSIPVGHYSKKEMRQKVDDLTAKLFSELEIKVAKHLRIPGLSY